jgi:uncharacterized protein (TIRG00374 family)
LNVPRFALRLVVAIGLTALVVWMSDPRAIGVALTQASWRWVLAACGLVLVDRALMAYRWWALLAPLGDRRPPLRTVMRIFFVSTFVGTFLPASIGGDVVRAWSLSREDVSPTLSVASVVLDRLLGIAGILLMAAVGLGLVPELARNAAVELALVMTSTGCVLVLALIFSVRLDEALRGQLGRLPARLASLLEKGLSGLQVYRKAHGVLLAVLLASGAVQVLRILQAWLLGIGVGINAPLAVYFGFIPIILLVMLLPITINGLGTSQLAFAWTFSQVGVATSDAVALSVLFVGLGIIGNLPGGLLYVTGPPLRVESFRSGNVD